LGFPLDVLGNKGGLFDIRGVWRLYNYLRKFRPSIVQSSQFVTNFHTLLAARLAHVPTVIIEEHGIYSWKKTHHLFIDRVFNSRADAIVACSHRVAESAAKHLKVPVSDVSVFHNCAAHEHFMDIVIDRRTLHRELFGASSSLVVTVVGTLRWEKGHRFLFDAWRQLMNDNALPSDAKLLVVGSGPLRDQLRSTTFDLPSVVFVGNRNDTNKILRASDLFVLPSVNEGFGIAIVEAMCAGLPIIATVNGGIPEVVDSGRTGVLVPPESTTHLAEAIKLLANDVDYRIKLGNAAKIEATQRFTPEIYVGQLRELYKRLGPPT
jgi:L-malate glycosyltransferase